MREALLEMLGRFNPTPWKIVGLIGAAMFGSRWLVQAWASKKAGRPVVPITFWVLSVTGSCLTLLYFIFYKPDSVGILTDRLKRGYGEGRGSLQTGLFGVRSYDGVTGSMTILENGDTDKSLTLLRVGVNGIEELF